MNEEFLEQIKNKNLQKYVMNNQNIQLLEEILNEEIKEFRPIQKLKEEGKLEFGTKLKKKEMPIILEEIKAEVDSFLGLENIETPRVGYFNLFRLDKINKTLLNIYSLGAFQFGLAAYSIITDGQMDLFSGAGIIIGAAFTGVAYKLHKKVKEGNSYNTLTKQIVLPRKKRATRVENIITIGHEYTHHALGCIGIKQEEKEYTLFSEGMGRGVEKHLARIYSEKEGNQAYAFDVLERSIHELKNAYIGLSTLCGNEPKETITSINTQYDSKKVQEFFEQIKKEKRVNKNMFEMMKGTIALATMNSHDSGSTLFSLLEAKHGTEVYKAAANGQIMFG